MKPSKEEALEAIKTILRYIGENPEREGLKSTPERVIKSFKEIYSGYEISPKEVLNTVFFDKANFQDFVLLKKISFHSLCEHHMLPFHGFVDIAYIPNKSIVGISKLARIVEVFSKRLQIQEKMTAEIAESIQETLDPLGVAVRISSTHMCMTMRGVKNHTSEMETIHFTGVFKEKKEFREEFLSQVR